MHGGLMPDASAGSWQGKHAEAAAEVARAVGTQKKGTSFGPGMAGAGGGLEELR